MAPLKLKNIEPGKSFEEVHNTQSASVNLFLKAIKQPQLLLDLEQLLGVPRELLGTHVLSQKTLPLG